MGGYLVSKAVFKIDWEEADPCLLRCPITGAVVTARYDFWSEEFTDEEPNWSGVPTVLFHYIPEIGEFDYIRPELQAKIDQKRHEIANDSDDDEELDNFEILQEHVTSIGKVPLIFQIETQELACMGVGEPLTSTVYVGLDLAAAATPTSADRGSFGATLTAAASDHR